MNENENENEEVHNCINYMGYFKNKLLEKRANKIVKQMFNKSTAILNQLSKNKADVSGGSRYWRNNSVTLDALLKAITDTCRQSVCGRHVLAVADTSEINYQSHRGKLSDEDQELGPVESK